MKDCFTINCTCRLGVHRFSQVLVERILWHEEKQHLRRSYGEEVIYTGGLIVDCDTEPRLLECRVYEYPKGAARVQQVFDGNNLVTDEVFISSTIHLDKKASDNHPYGTRFFNRTGGDHFILDSLVNGYAVKLDNDMILLLGIHIPVSFPLVPLPEMKVTKKKQQHYLPATVCCCMNAGSRKYSFGISRKLSGRIVGVLRKELDKLGFNPVVESRSTKNECLYYVGHCSEVNAANKVLRKKTTDLRYLVFSIAVRPRTMQIIEPCMNCATIFPTL